MRGIVYVLSHPAMPGLLKIGYTDRSLKERKAMLLKIVKQTPQV
jgi:hypothetical protein